MEVSTEAKGGPKWLEVIISKGRLNAIPLQGFTRRHGLDYQIHMDASDQGLCALFSEKKQYLQVYFTSAERSLSQRCHGAGDRSFGIIVRE
ncbi:LOW QUALITY PROTEIN: Cleavage induced protein [Phytophthora megakarya]|uniref:Cleavage induced protein n=1 Tax=Phytophthora megakarya TaxID=4795 RepID=A0A225WH20_9STRA|nr:LOW QUALITY PROTEIN: Cleavage induced protein [Phytophthora megakarya]